MGVTRDRRGPAGSAARARSPNANAPKFSADWYVRNQIPAGLN